MDREQVQAHDKVYSEGWRLVKGELLLGADPPKGPPGILARRRLLQAIECFEAALKLHPDGWQTWWALGKIHQRLEQPAESLAHFARAHELNPAHPDLAREAALAALDAGDGAAAVRFGKAACDAHPEDAGLVSNLALARLIAGDVDAARQSAADAAQLLPDDPIARAVRALIDDVAAGRRARPKSGRELR